MFQPMGGVRDEGLGLLWCPRLQKVTALRMASCGRVNDLQCKAQLPGVPSTSMRRNHQPPAA